MHFLEYLEHNNLVLAVLSSAKHKFIGVNTSIIVELHTDSNNIREIKKIDSKRFYNISLCLYFSFTVLGLFILLIVLGLPACIFPVHNNTTEIFLIQTIPPLIIETFAIRPKGGLFVSEVSEVSEWVSEWSDAFLVLYFFSI